MQRETCLIKPHLTHKAQCNMGPLRNLISLQSSLSIQGKVLNSKCIGYGLEEFEEAIFIHHTLKRLVRPPICFLRFIYRRSIHGDFCSELAVALFLYGFCFCFCWYSKEAAICRFVVIIFVYFILFRRWNKEVVL